LPLFIPMCIFTPSLVAILGYFIYLKTVKKYKDKKQLVKQDEEAATGITKEVELSMKVEKQIREFIDGGLKK
jgi:predicted membrane protein